MARKSRKNMPVAVAEPTDNLTAKAVLSMDKEAKPYQVGIYARLSFESEANKERDTVDTQIAYIREFINSQDDMVEVEVYADISVTGTTFERPEFDRMIQDIRAGRINTVITRDLSRLGRNYVEAGNYIERVFPFLDVRYIAITDDFDTARPGTDLSVPLKNIVNEYYSKDLSKKVETGKHSIWAQGGFSEGTPPYGYYRATDGSRKLLIDEEVSDNVVRIFNMFLDGKGYAGIAKTLQNEGILSPPKYRFYKSGKIELAEKAREWHYSHVKEILQGEYYIGNIVHGNATRVNWEEVCPKNEGDEIYIIGNPPYLGSRNQDAEQKSDMEFVFRKDYKNLDYVLIWFYKGAKFIENCNAQLALVSTNSICQGEQVSLFWPKILNDIIEISFAHQSFKWTNNAIGNAGVTVIIVGLRNKSTKPKYLYNNNIRREAKNINAYLLDVQDIYINSLNQPLSKFPRTN